MYESIKHLPPGAEKAVPYDQCEAFVWYLPYLDTIYDVTRRSMCGTVEIAFLNLENATEFFNLICKSNDIERAELLVNPRKIIKEFIH